MQDAILIGEDGSLSLRTAPTLLDLQLGTSWKHEVELHPLEAEFEPWFERAGYITLGNSCNQSCRYCFQDKSLGWESLEDAIAQVRVAANYGANAVFLIGGEPLIYPHVWELIDAINASSIPRWGIMTNGIALANEKVLQRLLDAGMGFVQLSFDSPRPDVQNALARNPRLFRRLERAFENMGKVEGLPLIFNGVITTENVDHLHEMVDFAADLRERYGLRTLVKFTQTKPGERVEEALVPRASVSGKAVIRAIERGKELDIGVAFRNLPYCVVDPYETFSTDYTTLLHQLDEGGQVEASRDLSYKKIEKCRECAHAVRCPGIQDKYMALFGDEEFQPVKRADIAPPTAAELSALDALLSGEQAQRDPYDDCSTELRVLVGEVRRGETNWFDVDRIVSERPRSRPGERVVLCGPEVMLHPELPAIIEQLSEERDVWIETTGLALTRPERAELLVQFGLKGVCWMHLPDNAKLYRKLIRRERKEVEVHRTADVIGTAGLRLEHRFLAIDEPIDHTLARVDRTLELAGGRGGASLSFLHNAEPWSKWLDATPRGLLDDTERSRVEAHPAAPTVLYRAPIGVERGPDGTAVPHEDRDRRLSRPTASLVLGTKCDFRCEFCYLDNHKTTASKEDTVRSVQRVLDAGYRDFRIAGGEPTLFPHLFDVLDTLAAADANGILITNGAKVSDPEFAERVWDAGIRDVLLSFHSHQPDVYDALAKRKNVFPNIMKAFEVLIDTGFTVDIHHVLYERNYRAFPDFVRFFGDNLYVPGRTRITATNVLLDNAEFAKMAGGIPRLTDILPYYREGRAIAREYGFEIDQLDSSDAFPECVFGIPDDPPTSMPRPRHMLDATSTSVGVVFAGAADEDPAEAFGATFYDAFEYVDACQTCVRKKVCVGVQRSYLAHYGDSEFRPILT